jgi:SAM-dependent methyltransferase
MFPVWWRHGLRFYAFTSAFGAGRFLPRYDFFRFLEHGLMYEHLDLRSENRVLDVGAGYSIFPLFLASQRQYEVHIIDNEAALPGVKAFHERKLKKLGLMKELHEGKVAVELQDARRLSYPAASFDRIVCISMINVVPQAGDSEIMKEIGRVLRPGGLAIVSFPYGPAYEERPSAPWCPYFTRTYDEAAIDDRLLAPSGLSEVARRYFGEWPVHVSRMYWLDVPVPFRMMFAASTPAWTLLCMRVSHTPNHTSGGAMLILQKPTVDPGADRV